MRVITSSKVVIVAIPLARIIVRPIIVWLVSLLWLLLLPVFLWPNPIVRLPHRIVLPHRRPIVMWSAWSWKIRASIIDRALSLTRWARNELKSSYIPGLRYFPRLLYWLLLFFCGFSSFFAGGCAGSPLVFISGSLFNRHCGTVGRLTVSLVHRTLCFITRSRAIPLELPGNGTSQDKAEIHN